MTDQPASELKPKCPCGREMTVVGLPGSGWICWECDATDGERIYKLSAELTAAQAQVAKLKEEVIAAIPSQCPITGMPFFMMIGSQSDPSVMVPTYGGPFDSYTMAVVEHEAGKPLHERDISNERYDHDEGAWKEGRESLSVRLIDEQVLFKLEDRAETAETAVAKLTAERDEARKDGERLDWLEKNASNELRIDGDGAYVQLDRWHRKYITCHSWGGETLRAAIDAAIADQAKGAQP